MADAIDLIAATEDGVWVVDQFDGAVIRVDPATFETVWESSVFGTIARLAVDGDYVWLLDQSSGVLTRLSSSTGAEAGQAPVGRWGHGPRGWARCGVVVPRGRHHLARRPSDP